jgi:hypothetical protein
VRLGYCFPVLALLFSLTSSTARADGYLTLAPDEVGYSCFVPDQGPVVTVYVLAKYTSGVTGFYFEAPVPASSGLQHFTDQSPYVLIGNSQSGVSVGLGQCMTGSFVVMTMLFYYSSPGEACTFYPKPAGAYYTDCNFAEHSINTGGVMLNSDGTCGQAKNVAPADGAADVPLTTSLSWIPGFSCDWNETYVFFGKSANPPMISMGAENPFPVGPLQPGTKYYWKIADPGSGPVWSFTTTNSVATRPSTWGAIKALYR